VALARLTQRHLRVAQLLALGRTCEQVAEDTGLRVDSVRHLREDPSIRAEMEAQRALFVKEAASDLRAASLEAVVFLRLALERATRSNDPKLLGPGVKAACAILDRAGLAPRPPLPDEHEVPDSIEKLLDLVPLAALQKLVREKEARARKGAK
jgi:hypothetical protein